MWQPSGSRESPAHEALRRIWGSFWVPSRNETAQWGARSGTIRRHFVGLEQSLAFQTRIVTSPLISAVKRFIRCRYGLVTVISRELARPGSSGLLCTCRQRRCGGAATPTPTAPEARSGGMYSETSRARTVEPLEALGIDPVVGPRFGFALRPRPKPHGLPIELEGGGGARRGASSVH